SAFNNIAQQIKQASDAGQPLPDVNNIISHLPNPPTNVDFYNQLAKAYDTQLGRLNMISQFTNNGLLSPQQVNAFVQTFVGKSKLVDKLDVQHTPAALDQATDIINDTINELATTDPTSTIYEQEKAGAQSLLQAHTTDGVCDLDNVVDFVA